MRRMEKNVSKENSLYEIQELASMASDKREYFEYKSIYYGRKLEGLKIKLRIARNSFLSFLQENGIDENFPVLRRELETEFPQISVDSVFSYYPVGEKSLPDIPDTTFMTLKDILITNYGSLEKKIEEHIDTILRYSLKKSQIEYELEKADRAVSEYRERVEKKKEKHGYHLENLEMINALHQNMLDFKFLISAIPDDLTSQASASFQNNNLESYGSYYYGKKNKISRMAENLQERFESGIDTDGLFMETMQKIAMIFGERGVVGIPDKYIEAAPQKSFILEKLNELSAEIEMLVKHEKRELGKIAGTSGTGNKLVDDLISASAQISEKMSDTGKVDNTDLNEVIESNRIYKEQSDKLMKDIKQKLKNGVENLDSKFISEYKHFLRKTALSMGFPVNYVSDRFTNLEDYLREKIRRKYGGDIPFCDEKVITDSKGNRYFVKESDIDPETGKKRTDAEAERIRRIIDDDRSIVN